MEGILRLRHEAARLLDFPSYAEYALADRMASSVPEVSSFLMQLAAPRAPVRAPNWRNSRPTRGARSSLGPELLLGTPAGEPLPGLAGGTA